jgi:hypothetical protein
MEESKERLRLAFEAETDVVIEAYPEDWKRYAEWLENLAIKKLNNEVIKENELLINAMQKAMKALDV